MKYSSFFSCKDYRDALEIQRNLQKELTPKKYSIQNLAEACGIHRSYLSKVMHQKAHLSEDQLYLAMEFLGFDERKTEFTELLYRWQRSEVEARRKALEAQIKKFNETTQHMTPDKIAQNARAKDIDINKFFLHPHAQVVHTFLCLERFRKQPATIMKELELDESSFRESLDFLESLGILKQENGEIVDFIDYFTFAMEAYITDSYHSMARNRGYYKMLMAPQKDRNVYTYMFTISPDTLEKLRMRRTQFLKEMHNIIDEDKTTSDNSMVYELHFDLFPWTKKA